MNEIALSDLIKLTKEAIYSFKYKPSTILRHELVWKGLSEYFIEHHQVNFSKQLAYHLKKQGETPDKLGDSQNANDQVN